MATVSLSKIKFNWRGEWSDTATYQVNDAVSYRGASFVCTTDTPQPTDIVVMDPNNLELRVVKTLSTKTVNVFGQPVGQTAAERRLAPLLSDGLAPQTFVVTYDGSAYTFSGVSGTNPTLKLTAGETYRFDCSGLATTASFALRTASGVTTNNPIGAVFNKPDTGVDSTTTSPQGTPYSTTIIYRVPTSALMTGIVYQSADNAGALGTIEIVNPADTVGVNSAYWKKVLGSGDEQVLTHRGDLFVEGDAGAPYTCHRQNPTTFSPAEAPGQAARCSRWSARPPARPVPTRSLHELEKQAARHHQRQQPDATVGQGKHLLLRRTSGHLLPPARAAHLFWHDDRRHRHDQQRRRGRHTPVHHGRHHDHLHDPVERA